MDSAYVQDVHGENSRPHDVHVDFLAGIVGGCAGVISSHPLDTVKVRLQSQEVARPTSTTRAGAPPSVLYRGPWHCLSSIARTEGVAGLYKGLSSPLFGVAVINSLLFGVYGWCIHHITPPERQHHPTPWEIFLAGSASGFINGFFSAPIELVKIRLQNQRGPLGTLRYRGPIDCVRQVYAAQGLRGCFKGLGVTLIRETPSYGLYFASYEMLSRVLLPPDPAFIAAAPGTGEVEGTQPAPPPLRLPPVLGIILAGGLAGVLGWLSTYPFDVVKTRMQSLEHATDPRYRTIRSAFSTILSGPRGWRVLFVGWSATAIRAFPTNAATFATVAAVRSLLLGE